MAIHATLTVSEETQGQCCDPAVGKAALTPLLPEPHISLICPLRDLTPLGTASTLGGLTMIDVSVYHDESKEGGYWHGLLIVPNTSRADLLGWLSEARRRSKYSDPLGIKNCNPSKTRRIACVSSWISAGVGSLLRHGTIPVDLGPVLEPGRGHRREPFLSPRPLNVKFGALHSPDGFASMGGPWTDLVETTLRIALKGLLHYQDLSSAEPLNIKSLILDGNRHYNRSLDEARVLGRLRGQLRSSITIADDARIVPLSSDHRCEPAAYGESQLLQLADCLIGGVRLLATDPSHHLVARGCLAPLRAIMDRFGAGTARMLNSRFGTNFTANSFGLTPEGEFEFSPVRCCQAEESEQLTLGF
jgi:hypothetical protein